MDDIESRVHLYREVIKTCITSDGVLSRLPDIISQAEATRLRQLYERDRQKATGQMLDDILRSDEPGKWKMFLSALEDDEYDYIASLLSSDGRSKEISCYERRIIQLFWPKLVDIIDPSELVSYLYQKRVINMEDMQYINTRYNTSGQRAGASILLDRMQCRKKPEEWYKAFLEALNETGYSQMVAELEPDFNKCPHSSGAEPMDDGVSSSSSQTSGNVLQNTVSDYGKAYEAANNFSAPTNMPESVCLIDSQTCEDRDIESDSPRNAQHVPELPDTLRIKTRKRTKDGFFIESGEKCCASEAKSRKASTQNEDPINEREYHLSSDDGGQLEKEIASIQENSNTVDGDCRLDDTNKDPYAAQNKGMQATFLNLRKYQKELAENALKGENTIICAGTGSGKTMVAMHIVEQHLKGKENGKVVFMARQSTLVKQQYDKFIQQLPSQECVLLTGENENSNKLPHLLEDYEIFFMTPQILLNNLENSQQKLRLYDFSLFILDECHHTKKEEAYNKLMRLYIETKLNLSILMTERTLPQIVGLTASVGVGNACHDIGAMDYILSICANMDAKNISTVARNLEEMKDYISIPTEEHISLKPRPDDVCKKNLIEGMNDIEEKLGDLVTLSRFHKAWNSRPAGKESQEYNNWTVKLMKEAKESQEVPEMSRNIQAGAKYLGILNSALEVNSLLMMDDVNQFLVDRVHDDLKRPEKLNDFEKELLDTLKAHVKKMSRDGRDKENPNVRYLSDVLSKMLEEKGDDSRAMVFVKARQTCKRLAEFLDKDLEHIDAAAAPLYGKEKRGDEEGMTESKQNETVERFRNGFYKVLVATSVGSEGIDVPDCNIVLSYNNTGNEIQKIQMSGRCRKEGGSTVILGDEAAVQKEKINAYKARMMYRAIEMVKALSQKEYDRKVKRFQNEEQRKAKLRRDIEERKQQMRTDENVYELVCGHCSIFACLSTDIRTLKSNHHIVVNKEFANRITVQPIQEKKFDGMTKQSKIECHNCGKEWGIILVCNGCKCWTLLLKAFKVSKKDDEASGAATYTVYKQWRDVPFKLREIQDDEFKDLISIVQMK